MKDESWGEWEPVDNSTWGAWEPVEKPSAPVPATAEQYPDQVSRSHAEASAPVAAPAPDEMDTMGVGTKAPTQTVGQSLKQTGSDLATVYGPAEAAVNAATGFLFGFPGYVGGAIGGLADATGRVIAGEDASTIPQTMKERAEAVSQAFTYQPQTEAGKRLSEGLMYPLKAIAESGGPEGVGGAVATGASKLGLPDTASAWAGAAADASWQMAATVLGAKAIGMAMPERAGPKPNVKPTPEDERAFGEKLRATILDPEAPQEQRAAAASAVASRIHDVDPAAAEVFLSNTMDAIKNNRPVDLSANAANKMKDTSLGGDLEGQFTRESDVQQLTGPESGRAAPEGELTGEVDPLTLEPIRRPVDNSTAPIAEEPAVPEAPRALPSPNQVAIPMGEERGPFSQDIVSPGEANAAKIYGARAAVEAARQPAAHEIPLDPNDIAGSIKAISEAPITPVKRALEAPRNVDVATHANAAGDLAGIMLSIDHLSRQEKVTPPAQRPAIREQIARLQVEARQAIANHGAQFGPEAGQSMHRVAAETFHNMKGDYRSLVRPPAVPQIESVKSDNASNIGQNNAVREQTAGEVLQRQPSEAGGAGSERGRVEQGVQGQEAASPSEAVPAQGNSEFSRPVSPLADHVGALPVESKPLPPQTESQKILPATRENVLAGNAALDHRKLGPFNISVENRAGTTRTDMHNIPPKWQSEMKADYGYAKGTTGNDGDHLDFFIKKGTPEDYNGKMYVVDQHNAKGGFDEHKVMAGYGSLEEAKAAYLAHYPKGWTGLKNISEVSTAGLKHWSRFGDMKKPYAEKVLTDDEHKVNFNKGSFQDRVDQLMKDHGMTHEDALAEAKTEMAQKAPVNAEITPTQKTGNLLTRAARANPRAGVSEIRGLEHLVLDEPKGQFLGNAHADGLNARKLTIKEHAVVAGMIKDVLGAGVPQHYFDGLTPFVVFDGMAGASAVHMLSERDAAIGLSSHVMDLMARGDERAMRAMPMILIHELGHHMDTQKAAIGWKQASDGSSLAHQRGAVMNEAVEYWKNGSDQDLQQFLSYPLALDGLTAGEYQEELFAQHTALWYTQNDLMRNELPLAHALMEKVHEAVTANPEGIGGARIAVRDAVRSFTPGESNVRSGRGSNRPAESDKRSAAHRDTSSGLVDVARGSAENDRLGSVEGKQADSGLKKAKTPAVSPAVQYSDGSKPSPLKGRVTVNDIGAHFDALAKKDGGPFDMANPDHVKRAVKLATQEFRHQLKQARTGLNWYSEDIKSAHELTSKFIPELLHGSGEDSVLGAATGEVHRQAFSIVAGIHSPSTDARANWENAGEAYKVFTQTGKLPEINPETNARWGPHINPLPSAHFNSMVEDMGLEKTVEWLLTPHPVSELNAMKLKYGIYKNAPVSGKRTDIKLGAHIFGPKVGPFSLGLNGFDTEVAVDKWATRTVGRYFGNIMKDGVSVESPTEQQRRVFTQIAVDIGKETGYTPNQVQAVLWFFEQHLYSAMGLDSESAYFSDGARDLLRRQGIEHDTGTAVGTGEERRTRAGPPTQAGEATVNIGLNTNDGKGITVKEAVAAIEATGARVTRQTQTESSTEPTLVATLDRALTPEEAHKLSVDLNQEAIVQRVGTTGELHGPQAAKWGAFNQKEFKDHPGDGRGFTDFFTAASKGERAPDVKSYKPVIDISSIKDFSDEYVKHRGNFDDHIATSIPGFREVQQAVGDAIVKSYPVPGKRSAATMLDIAASEGAFNKTITKLSDGAIFTLALDPNLQMAKFFDEHSQVSGADYDTSAFGFGKNAKAEEGTLAWREKGGHRIEYFKPIEKYDIVHESMGFQFIDGDREAQFARVKELMRPDGIALFEEKVKEDTPEWYANEKQKDAYKAQYYTQAQMKAKAAEVLAKGETSKAEQAVVGMNDLMVTTPALEKALSDNWKHVTQYWSSGNFKGYIASDSAEAVQRFVSNLPNLNSEFSTVQTPHTVTGEKVAAQEPIEASVEPVEKKTSMSRHNFRTLTPEQEAAMKNTGGIVDKATLKQRYQNATSNIGMKVKQGMVDQFAPLKDLDPKAYMLARLSKASDGALEAMMTYGNLSMLDGVTDSKAGGLGVIDSLQKLQGEHHEFMWWVAAHRAEQLTADQRENLFSQQDITALKTLNLGTMPDGSSRQAAYLTALKEYNAFSRNILDIAEQSGIIDGASRSIWEKEFYVPFYRAIEDGHSTPNISRSSGLVRQYAFKKLKGGSKRLHQDLLANVLMNWSHLLSASAKNRAAEASLKAAEQIGIATQVPNETKGAVWYLKDGKQVSYEVDDPFVLDAVTALEAGIVGGWAGKTLSKVKNLLTIGVTANPTFKIRNLIRDSIASIAQSELSYNVAGNVLGGVNEMRKKGQVYASMLAGGGLIRFGSMLEGNRSHHVDKLVKAGVEARTILDTRDKMLGMAQVVWDHYNELGDISEGANRASLYKQMRAAGKTHAEATMAARDLLDFSMGGSWGAVRFLTQTVPFMNARIQGLYKLGKEAGNRPGRMAAVIGGVALASILLMSYYSDDPDWKKREDWDRDNYWWFKIGDTAYRIPKPFEVGAIATLAEHGVELFTNNEMTKKRFLERVQYALSQTFSLNPVPQLAKPVLDVYANTNSFTGNPIEGKSAENLKKEDRSTASTSEFSKAFSPATTAVASLVGAPGISPVQLDYLVKGYFGWLGTMAMAASDAAVHPFMDRATQASAKMKDWPIVGNFAEELPSDSSRYVTQFYKQAKEIEEAYASYNAKKASGDKQAAADAKAEDLAKIKLEPKATGFTRQLSEVNAAIRKIEAAREMDPDTKRTKLSIQYARRNAIAEKAARLTEFE